MMKGKEKALSLIVLADRIKATRTGFTPFIYPSIISKHRRNYHENSKIDKRRFNEICP